LEADEIPRSVLPTDNEGLGLLPKVRFLEKLRVLILKERHINSYAVTNAPPTKGTKWVVWKHTVSKVGIDNYKAIYG
jgi:hypothetical protein